ncbi:MAG: hypothetical protein EOP38_16695 [Rubrivivax sp.]|nr:MAG: hypothetical protein EOP38_16695 [Rubrivivax sp.]
MAVGTTRTAGSDMTDQEACLGVAVVNYRMPRLGDAADALANAHRIRQMVEGLKLGLVGMELVVFPPHGARTPHGPPPSGEARLASHDVLAVLARACRNAQVWGLFPLPAPQAAMILLNTQGEPVQAWYPSAPGAVAEGPRGWKLGLVMGPEDESAAGWRHAEQRGAELIVRACSDANPVSDGLATPGIDRLRAQARACGAYVAMAHATGGAPGAHNRLPLSHSVIVDFHGEVLGECGEQPYGACHAALSRHRLRDARALLDTGPESDVTSVMRGPQSHPAGRPPGAAAPPAKP